MTKKIVTQIIVIGILVAGVSGMVLTTTVYDDVLNKIVTVLCLSCVKLEPRTQLDFTFDTATGDPHPMFVLENLSQGPVFLHYRTDVCAACDAMEPVIKDVFGVSYDTKDQFYTTVLFGDTNVTFIHINLDHTDEAGRTSFGIYDKDYVNGVPMYTIVTLGYHPAHVKPYYATGYGFLGAESPQDARGVLMDIITEATVIYQENQVGYNPL